MNTHLNKNKKIDKKILKPNKNINSIIFSNIQDINIINNFINYFNI